MKKIIFLFLALGLTSKGFCYWDTVHVNSSSWTAVAVTTKYVDNTLPGNVFVGVIISSPSSLGMLTFYDSSGTATNIIGSVLTTTVNSYLFNVSLSSGLSFTSSGIPGGATILFKKLR